MLFRSDQAANNGFTSLCIASQEGHEPVVRLLLKHGATVDQAANNGFTSLCVASGQGHEPVVRLLLKHGATVDQAGNTGATSLCIASQFGHEAVVRLLLDRGAAIEHACHYGRTALYRACNCKHEAVARVLARRGAIIHPRDADVAEEKGLRSFAKWLRRVSNHATPLHWACENRDREGLLRSLRSGEFERALPSLADLKTIAAHKHAPVCERTTTLLRLAYEPWGVLRRHLWPRSFRGGVAAVMNAGGELDDGIRFTVLSFCCRDWWAGGHRPGASAPYSVPEVPLSRRICDGCQRCPMDRATELKRCSGCRAVYYCTRVDDSGKAACQHAAWSGHKRACKKATRARARREEVEAAVAAGAAAEVEAAAAAATVEAAESAAATAEEKKIAKAKKQAAHKKEQKKRRKQHQSA